MGHSSGGPLIISFAVNHPELLSKLILVDTQMNRDKAERRVKDWESENLDPVQFSRRNLTTTSIS
jgi:pimeloyl-ACP methyl ester carboxylesterase